MIKSLIISGLIHFIWCTLGCLLIWSCWGLGWLWCGAVASMVYFYLLYFFFDSSSRYIYRIFKVIKVVV